MSTTEMEDVGEVALRKLNTHADSWWLTLATSVVQNEMQLGLLFRWGRHGGGFLLPVETIPG